MHARKHALRVGAAPAVWIFGGYDLLPKSKIQACIGRSWDEFYRRGLDSRQVEMNHPVGANKMTGGAAGAKLLDAHGILLHQPITLAQSRSGKNPTSRKTREMSIPYHCLAVRPAYNAAVCLDTEEP